MEQMQNTTDSAYNLTALAKNETVKQLARYFNISIYNITHESAETQAKLFNQFELKEEAKDPQLLIKLLAFSIGAIIILSNLTVVVSSGLILKRGQKPKSTYILLGNVSLADTIVGISIIFGKSVDKNMGPTNPLCIFQTGLLVCSAMVSIFSVCFIAIDRYFYILHGLYYDRYFNTTRVRIGIAFIWAVAIILAYMPATGWVNREIYYTRCYYTAVFPRPMVLLHSFLCIIHILVVAILYSIILIKALANVNKIKNAKKSGTTDPEKPQLRMSRGNSNAQKNYNSNSAKYPAANAVNSNTLKRCASYDNHQENKTDPSTTIKSKSQGDLAHENYQNTELNKTQSSSELSIYTISSSNPTFSSSSEISENPNVEDRKSENPNVVNDKHETKKKQKPKEPKKWRAITVVMLTSGSFIVTWMPFFIGVIFFMFCEEKATNPKCLKLRSMLRGPVIILAFINSILNPLIYAWWHKGFKKSVKACYRKYFKNFSFFNSTKL